MPGIVDILTGGLVESVGKVASDLITTDKERMQLALQDKELDQRLALGQIEINKAEAQNASLFVAGGRPFIIWICGIALGLVYIPKAVVMAGIWTYAATRLVVGWNGAGEFPMLPPYPELGVVDLVSLIGALLGLGAMRTVETLQGKARSDPLTPFPNPFRRKPAELEAP